LLGNIIVSISLVKHFFKTIAFSRGTCFAIRCVQAQKFDNKLLKLHSLKGPPKNILTYILMKRKITSSEVSTFLRQPPRFLKKLKQHSLPYPAFCNTLFRL